MRIILTGIFVLLSILSCKSSDKNSNDLIDLLEQQACIEKINNQDSISYKSYVVAESRNKDISQNKSEIALKTELYQIVYNHLSDLLKPNDLWGKENILATGSLEKLVNLILFNNSEKIIKHVCSQTILKDEIYTTHIVGKINYLDLSEKIKEIAYSNAILPEGFNQKNLLSIVNFYDRILLQHYSSLLNNMKFTNSDFFDKLAGIYSLGNDIAFQLHYKKKGLEEWKYPFYEEYEPYTFYQTAWDTLFVFSNTDLKLNKKIGLDLSAKKIKELKLVENDNNKLLFIQYQKGFELHKLLSNKDSLLTTHQSADLSTISPDGKKITYVEYKEFAVPEVSYFANCMVDYYIDNEMLITFNRLYSSPYDDSYYEENVSQMQKVDDNDKYTYLNYNKNNQLVYKKYNRKKIALTVDFIPPPRPIYYYESSINVPSKIIDTQFFPESNLLYILSYVDDFEIDYIGYRISMLNIDSGEYYAHVKTEPYDTKNIIEFNPETSAPSEIRDKLTFELDKDYKQDSIDLYSYFPETNDFFIREYVYDIQDSILVFSDESGLIKMNINTKEYFQFGYADILIWINNMGSTNSLFNYKSIYLTDDNKILTIQENNTILLWDIKILSEK